MVYAVTGGKLAHVELAQQDSSCLTQSADHSSIFVGHKVGQDDGAPSGQQILGPELVFDGEWHAVKRPKGLAPSNGILRLASRRQGLVTAHSDVAVELAVDGLDAV